jgi:ATP-dependent DNA helicase RecG
MDSATTGTGGSGGVTTHKTTQKILAMLARNPSFSRREIAQELGDISENGVKYHLEKLKASGRIRRLGADKGGYWEVLK